VIQILRCRPTF